jgi:hypothetical protein
MYVKELQCEGVVQDRSQFWKYSEHDIESSRIVTCG